MKKLKVKWLAINDPLVEVQHLKYSLSDLTPIAFGTYVLFSIKLRRGSRYVQLPVGF